MYQEEYKRWMAADLEDADLMPELTKIEGNDDEIKDRFAVALKFGTAGLRGVLGAGTNRMNIYTVRKATQGLANYIIKAGKQSQGVAIAYDSRHMSPEFADEAALCLAANGIKAYVFESLRPTPELSYAVRKLGCTAGINITASHNPPEYNGYKVYGADGCQITTKAADAILAEIEKLDLFDDVKRVSFKEALNVNKVSYISDRVYDDFIEEVKKQSLLSDDLAINKDVSIVYTPLNGTGLKPVLRALKESGYTNITVVKEQEQPDGYFTTCPYPNPEIKEAMELGIAYAKKCNADLLLATDPDCDRVGIAVKNKQGEHVLVTGNEVGMLLLDYICSRRIAMETMPEDPVAVKTIVTIDMAERIAEHYGVKVINVLTGFKFIGEQIGLLEKRGKEDSYIFGFEESYGYLSGGYVRDKDAVNGAFLICEMFAYYAALGISLLDKLNELYEQYGYCLNTLHSYEFEGAAGFDKMQRIMADFRAGITSFAGKKVIKCNDYKEGVDGLPKSDVLKYFLEDHCSVVVRPSGTEPKLKTYISVSAENREKAVMVEQDIACELERKMK